MSSPKAGSVPAWTSVSTRSTKVSINVSTFSLCQVRACRPYIGTLFAEAPPSRALGALTAFGFRQCSGPGASAIILLLPLDSPAFWRGAATSAQDSASVHGLYGGIVRCHSPRTEEDRHGREVEEASCVQPRLPRNRGEGADGQPEGEKAEEEVAREVARSGASADQERAPLPVHSW